MSEENPYKPPVIVDVAKPAAASGGIWQSGGLLVVLRGAVLPDICVKSNEPCHRRLKRSLAWFPPWAYILILAGLLIFVIVALVLTKRATIMIGLSDEWFARRRKRTLITCLLILLSVGMVVGGVMLDYHQFPFKGWVIGGGVLMFFVVAIAGSMLVRWVSPKRMDDRFTWLTGVHPGFVSRFPHWPHHY